MRTLQVFVRGPIFLVMEKVSSLNIYLVVGNAGPATRSFQAIRIIRECLRHDVYLIPYTLPSSHMYPDDLMQDQQNRQGVVVNYDTTSEKTVDESESSPI